MYKNNSYLSKLINCPIVMWVFFTQPSMALMVLGFVQCAKSYKHILGETFWAPGSWFIFRLTESQIWVSTPFRQVHFVKTYLIFSHYHHWNNWPPFSGLLNWSLMKFLFLCLKILNFKCDWLLQYALIHTRKHNPWSVLTWLLTFSTDFSLEIAWLCFFFNFQIVVLDHLFDSFFSRAQQKPSGGLFSWFDRWRWHL